uniref:VP2 n=1 Tax=Avocet calicivirus TaxID=2212749 RepID=A0A3G1RP83_9CALI|nr:MAG: VP2 [Avocet calicivirus]
MATISAGIAAGSQAVAAGGGLIGGIVDAVYRGKELELQKQMFEANKDYNNKALALSVISPFISASASSFATQQAIKGKADALRSLGATEASIAAIAAGQDGVVVNGVTVPYVYKNMYGNNFGGSSYRPPNVGGFNSSTINIQKTTNNQTVPYEPSLGSSYWGSRRGSYSVASSTVSSGSRRSYTLNSTQSSRSSISSMLRNYEQFGFLAPGGTRL